MNKQSRREFVENFNTLGAKYLEYVVKPDNYELLKETNGLSTEAFKNTIQNRLEMCQKDVNKWFKDLIIKVGEYSENN